MQAAMAKWKKHSRAEMATKLAQANELATQGKLQSEIARILGVSVMTLHLGILWAENTARKGRNSFRRNWVN